METGDRFNQLKYAMNTRMFLLIAGILLIFNSVTSNIPYGMRFFAIAQMVSEYEANGGSGNKEVTAPEGKAESPVSGVESVVESVAADLQESAVESVAEGIQEKAAAGTQTNSQEPDVAALKADMDKLGVTVSDFRKVGVMNIVMGVIRLLIGLLCVVFCNRVDKARLTFIAAIILAVCEALFAIFLYINRFLGLGSLLYSVLITGILLFGAIRMRKLAKENPERKFAMEPGKRGGGASRPAAPKKSIKERAMMGSEADEEEKQDEE